MSSTISQTSAASSAADVYTQAQTQAAASGQTLNQGDFLKLLVAQLSAQDPMQPVSNTDFLAQMAQFSSLQGTQDMQKNLAGLQASQSEMQANSLLGKTVQVQGAQGLPVTGTVSAVGLQAGTPSLTVNGQSYDLSQVLSVSLAQPQP